MQLSSSDRATVAAAATLPTKPCAHTTATVASQTAVATPPTVASPEATATGLRQVFNRMGFDDKEIVALSSAHAVSKKHTRRTFLNVLFVLHHEFFFR